MTTMSQVPALQRIEVENYRSLRKVAVDLGPVNVLVGPNGAGKSNFLDVIEFLGDSVREDLMPALDRRGGFDSVYFRGDPSGNGSIRIRVTASVTSHSSDRAKDEYTLTFRRPPNLRQRILRWETFKFKRFQGPGKRITIKGSKLEIVQTKKGETAGVGRHQLSLGLRQEALGLALLPRLDDKEGGAEVRRMAAVFSSFRVFNPDVAAASRPTRYRLDDHLESDASNLGPFFAWLWNKHPDRMEALEEDAREMIPGFRELTFGGPDEPQLAVKVTERGLGTGTMLNEMSFGSIRTLALLALLYDPNPPLLTCIEEIDHGLHPYLFDRLMDRVRDASLATQFLIATHSPALVNRLRPDELLVCERAADGSTLLPAVSAHEIRRQESAANHELGLGEIWFTGSLGGVPD